MNTVVEFDKNSFIAGYTISPDNKYLRRIQQYMNDCLVALDGPKAYPFHGEVWVTPEEDIVFCEVASRAGGGGIPYQIIEACGVSLSKAHVQFQCGIPCTIPDLDTPWQDRSLVSSDLIGWVYVYPLIVFVVYCVDV